MMIGLICVEEGRAPFIQKYITLLKKKSIDYEIIIWNRNGSKKTDIENAVIFSDKSNRTSSIYEKFPHFLRFRRFVIKRIKKQKYEKIIFLTTLSAFFLPLSLFKQYKDKFILDYRDSSYEYLSFFKRKLSRIVNYSDFTCISSRGFLEILPKSNKYIITHNYKERDIQNEIFDYQKKSGDEILTISYIGVLREYEYMTNLIMQFANDSRFLLNIHGAGEILDDLRNFSKNYDNISITGSYVESEKESLILNSDILCYNYPPSYINNCALANKFYDGLIYKKIMFGNIDTFSGKLIKNNYLGISLSDVEEEKNNKIFEFYHTLNSDLFIKNSHNFLVKAIEEEKYCINKINNFFNK